MGRLLLALAAALAFAAPAHALSAAEIQANGYFDFNVRDVNDSGQVVGTARISQADVNTAPTRGFRWEGPGGAFLPLEPEGSCCNVKPFSQGIAINNAGVVAGTSSTWTEGENPSQPERDCLEVQGARYELGGGRTMLRGFGRPRGDAICPRDTSSESTAINDSGVVVGVSPGACSRQPFRTEGSTLVAVGPCDRFDLTAVDINDLGDVLVSRGIGAGRLYRSTGETVDLPMPVSRINDRGTILGAENGKSTLYGNGTKRVLEPLPGYSSAGARDLAEDDTVIGTSYGGPRPSTPTLWRPDGTVVDLNAALGAGAPFELDAGIGISDDGRYVVGWIVAEDAQGEGLRSFRMKLAEEPELAVKVEAVLPDGSAAADRVLVQEDLLAKLTVTNEGDLPLRSFSFAGGTPLVVDGRGTGGLGKLGAIGFPADMVLAPDESQSAYLGLTALSEGVAAVHSKVTAQTEAGVPVEGSGSLLFRIANRQRLTAALEQYVLLRAIDSYVFENLRNYHAKLRDHAQELRKGLLRVLDRKERRRWFGSEAGRLDISILDRATGFLRGEAPELVAAETPRDPRGRLTVDRLNREYDEAFKKEVGEGVSKWVKGWQEMSGSVKKGLADTWAESVLGLHYVMNTATREERLQAEAMVMTFADGVEADGSSVVGILKTEIPKWRENGTYAVQALQEAERNGGIRGFVRGVNSALEAYDKATTIPKDVLDLADSDPLRMQRELAKRDAGYLNAGLPTIFETLIGAAPARILAAGRKIKVLGKGASVLEAAEASGVLDDAGRVVKRPDAIRSSVDDVASGLSTQAAVEMDKAESLLANTKGATLVQASDVGNVYELPNLGGVPEVTLEAKAGILRSIESDYTKAFGKPAPKLVEVLKTSSALRKPGSVAKLELTAGKTGKPAMVDAGMPADALAEAAYWRSPTDPRRRPGFGDLSIARQQAAIKEWELANKRWKTYADPPSGSKEAKLKSLIGKRGRVPLDDAPNESGLQRFVTGEFEEVTVREGDAVAKLIRVKHYEIEVVDTVRGQVVNKKTVIDNLSKAAAQTADADAVAVGKVVGTDAKGAPIVAPLERAEREFVMSRYVDRNIKARRSGAIPDLAEHGVTLVMEDASARAAGYLLPQFGAPFLPETVGRAYLQRIAPFVKAPGTSTDEMVDQMLAAVRSEGGFGQHAVVVTSDSRYLGEVPFERW